MISSRPQKKALKTSTSMETYFLNLDVIFETAITGYLLILANLGKNQIKNQKIIQIKNQINQAYLKKPNRPGPARNPGSRPWNLVSHPEPES